MNCKRDPNTGRFFTGGAFKTLEERFWEKVRKTDSCWLWTGSVHRFGYGQMFVRWESGKGSFPRVAHRVSWELHKGAIPDGVKVLHRCDNPRCVNPDHLFLGTQADNMHDMCSKGRHFTKVPPHVVEAVLNKSITPKELTEQYGVHPNYWYTIRSVASRRTR